MSDDIWMPPPASPFSLDRAPAGDAAIAAWRGARVLYDANVIGDSARARVSRRLIDALRAAGAQVSVRVGGEVENDAGGPRGDGVYDLHLRDAWPPCADAMAGRVNASVWLAADADAPPRAMIAQLNACCDLAVVATHAAAARLRGAGLIIPAHVVGCGVDVPARPDVAGGSARRFLHVVSSARDEDTAALIEAFGRGFAASDAVELVIKTMDGAHAQPSSRACDIEACVARAARRRSDAAAILLVTAPASADEVSRLLRASTALGGIAPQAEADPTLPEAMGLGVPAIAVGVEGQAEVCTSETALLVPARPDAETLLAALRATLDDSAAAKARAEQGRARLRAHFKWSDVVRRLALAFEAARRAPPRPAPAAADISIDLVSSWAQTCGVATYAEHLFGAPALGPRLKAVFARELRDDARAPPDGTTAPAELSRPWGYEPAGAARLASALAAAQGDVCWVQHQPGFFADDDMETIVAALETSAHRLRAVTLHNARDLAAPGRARWLSAFDLVFVHTRRDAELLARAHGVPAVRVPHGILAAPTPPDAPTPAPEVVTVGTFGFLYPHKNVPLLIEAFALARRFAPNLRLALLTCVRDDREALKERARVEQAIATLGLGDVVAADFRFLPDATVLECLRACDFLCFPYAFSPESATGAARMALAADRPILCSTSPVLDDLAPCALTLARCDLAHLAEALIVMASQPAVRGLRDRERRRIVAETCYANVAETFARRLRRHLDAAPTPEATCV